MPSLLPARKSPSGSVGLDLDGGYVAAVQLSDGRVARAVSAELPPGLVADGEVVDEQGLGETLKEFFKQHKLPRAVRLGVANQQIVVRQLELPRIEDPDDRAAAVRFQAAEAIAMPLDEAVLDHQEVGETISPEGAARDRLVVVAAREAMVAKLVNAVRAAGLRPEGVDLSAFALVRALAGDRPDDEKARVFCHLGGVTNLAVAVGNSCLFTRALSTTFVEAEAPAPAEAPAVAAAPAADEATDPSASAGEPFAGGSAEGPGAGEHAMGEPASTEPSPPAEPQFAEPAPAEPSFAAAALPTDPSQAVGALAEEIRLSIDFYMGQAAARWVGDVVLSGPGAAREGLAEELASMLGLPVAVADPLGGLDASGIPADEDRHRHTVAAGLAMGAAA